MILLEIAISWRHSCQFASRALEGEMAGQQRNHDDAISGILSFMAEKSVKGNRHHEPF